MIPVKKLSRLIQIVFVIFVCVLLMTRAAGNWSPPAGAAQPPVRARDPNLALPLKFNQKQKVAASESPTHAVSQPGPARMAPGANPPSSRVLGA